MLFLFQQSRALPRAAGLSLSVSHALALHLDGRREVAQERRGFREVTVRFLGL